MTIISLYTALLAMLFFVLSVKTIRTRRKTKIAIGHNGNTEMLRAMRAHANFSEYVPLTLFAIYLAEAQGANSILIHILGATLLTARLLHAYGITQEKENFKFRVTGMALTFSVLLITAGYLIIAFLIR